MGFSAAARRLPAVGHRRLARRPLPHSATRPKAPIPPSLEVACPSWDLRQISIANGTWQHDRENIVTKTPYSTPSFAQFREIMQILREKIGRRILPSRHVGAFVGRPGDFANGSKMPGHAPSKGESERTGELRTRRFETQRHRG